MSQVRVSLRKVDQSPVLFVLEGQALTPFNLGESVDNDDRIPLIYMVGKETEDSLPAGLSIDDEGFLVGTPEKGTAREQGYAILIEVQARNPAERLPTALLFWILIRVFTPPQYEAFEAEVAEYEAYHHRKETLGLESYWRKILSKLPVPDLESILKREVFASDVEQLLERFATLTVSHSGKQMPEGQGTLLSLPDASARYRVYDFGEAVIATPVDLFDPERTGQDAIVTSEAVAREIVRRGWDVDLSGFEKMRRAAWVEIERANVVLPERPIVVRGYQPTERDYERVNKVIKPE